MKRRRVVPIDGYARSDRRARYSVANGGRHCLGRQVDIEARIALVAATWTPSQLLHPGNLAWHGTGCDGAPPADATLGGPGWFADVWRDGVAAEVEGHFSPALGAPARASAFQRIRDIAAAGCITVVAGSPMARTVRGAGADDVVGAPYFLLQRKDLIDDRAFRLPGGYSIITAADAGDEVRVEAHRRAWAPARIKGLLGLDVSGSEPPSSFTLEKYRMMKQVSTYRPELDLVAVSADGEPAAYALGWFDQRSGSVLFEPVGTLPGHARKGLARATCRAVMNAARGLGASMAVVGPRGDDAYPAARNLYESLGFETFGRTEMLAWS